MIQIGQLVDDRYEILKEIDRGGMSIVYLATDNRLKKSVVVKDVRKSKKIDHDTLIKCLQAEVDLLKDLDHPNLPKIYDIIDNRGSIYVVMDYIEGESLKKKFKREGKINVNDIITWAKQISDVLGYLHTRKPAPIIYRDMKPDNIMLTPEGKIKLIDFGIAIKEDDTETTRFGTGTYAAPEQVLNNVTDARTDIYSLGVTLHQLVTGKTYKSNTDLPPIRTIDPSLPEGLERILAKCTQQDPGDRYQNCIELSRDLKNIDKLTATYKKEVIIKIMPFILSVTFILIGILITVIGSNGLKSIKRNEYKAILNEAGAKLMEGNTTDAIRLVDKAITEVDSKRPEGYIYLLDIYKMIENPKEGIAKVEGYMDQKYGNVDKNDEVLFNVGMNYMDTKNYQMAMTYFEKVNKRKMPDVKYYKSIATSLSSMNINYATFTQQLEEFERYNDALPNDESKLINYLTLCNIFGSYKGQISEANDRIIEIFNKADKVITSLEDESLENKYKLDFYQQLAQAFHSKGSAEDDSNSERAKKYYESALEYYKVLLDEGYPYQDIIYIKKGDIYLEVKNYDKALEEYRTAIERNENSIKAYCKLIEAFVDVEQSKQQGQNYDIVKDYYTKVSRIEGSSKDEDYKKLTRRLSNLGIL
ncbi:MAG: serine/threonine-protein kinase [Clostridium sp.]